MELKEGVVHTIPDDLREVLESSSELSLLWNALTSLARNEWICWVTIPKQQKTRDEHLKRLPVDMRDAHKRPCCWPGCPHRNPNAAKWYEKK